MALPSTDTTEIAGGLRPLDDLARRGLAIYQERLRALLEPAHDGQAVAIHVDSEDYAVAPGRGAAVRALRSRHPEGHVVVLRIGTQPDYGLAARLATSRAGDREAE